MFLFAYNILFYFFINSDVSFVQLKHLNLTETPIQLDTNRCGVILRPLRLKRISVVIEFTCVFAC